MASIIRPVITIGDSSEKLRQCPTVTDCASPFISWTLPEGVKQRRFNLKIECDEPGKIGYFSSGEIVSEAQSFQYPLGNPMNDQFEGRCSIQLAISENANIGEEFENTTPSYVYVFDTVSESLYNESRATVCWDNVVDADGDQNIRYGLIVSLSPYLSNPIVSEWVAQDSGLSRTSHSFDVEPGNTYYWKVCAHDGYDYSGYSQLNGFTNHLGFPPEIFITRVDVTGNKYGDVYISFTTSDPDGEDSFVTSEYSGGNSGGVRSRMTLINATGKVPPGEHVIIWRSGKDEKLVSAGNYMIYLTASDSLGLSCTAEYGTFNMDNSSIGGDAGGVGSIELNFPSSVSFAKMVNYDDFMIKLPLSGSAFSDIKSLSEHVSPMTSEFKLWKNYATCLLNPYLSYQGSPVLFTPGMSLSSKTFKGTDLDSGDPAFTSSLDFFAQDGWHIQTDEKTWSYSGKRDGYVRFMHNFQYDRGLCPECSGKGWRVSDLRIENGRRIRVSCPQCGGSRFNESPEPAKWFSISDYRPVSEWFSPEKDCFAAFSVGMNESDLGGTQFLYGSMARADSKWPSSSKYPSRYFQKEAPSCSIGGISPFINGGLSIASRVVSQYLSVSCIPLTGEFGPDKVLLDFDSGPFSGGIAPEKQDYVPGYDVSENPGFANRPTPTNRWERGIWPISGNLYKRSLMEQMRIIYLQSGWDAFNTIHWKAALGPLTRIHLQVAKFFPDNSRSEYVDVRSELSSPVQEAGGSYLVAPNLWHTYWDTARKQVLEEGFDYRFRIRQFDMTSKSFSQWVYSSRFSINHSGSNPASILSAQFDGWGSRLVVNFRIDDTQYDRYNITRVWYNFEDGAFSEISMEDLSGDITELSSEEGSNIHSLVWNASMYSLSPGDRYRVKIEVIPTKMIGEMTIPVLKWSKELNPVHVMAESEVLRLSGQAQKYVYNQVSGEFEERDVAVVLPGEISRMEDEIEAINSYPPPSGKYQFFTDGELTDSEGYSAWLADYLVPGITRQQVLLEKARELDDIRSVQLPYWQNEMDEAERRVRKYLIDQGFYCNGFVGNNPAGGAFRFRVESMAVGDEILNEDGSYKIVYDPRFEVYHRVQMDFFLSFDSQGGYPLRDFMYRGDGSRIQGGDAGRPYYDTPSGTVVNTYVSDSTWNGFGDGEGQAWDTGLLADGSLSNEETYSAPQEAQRIFTDFTIPKSELPGERVDEFISNARPSVTDILPSGISSFETVYQWRVASYNLVNGPARERPRHVSGTPVMNFTSSEPPVLSSISIPYVMYGDPDLQSSNLARIVYSSESKDPSWDNASEVLFPTDRPEGYEAPDDYNPVMWTPVGKNRSRPSVAYCDGKYYMWYSKKTSSGEEGIIHARGKDYGNFGEYSISIPEKDGYPLGLYSDNAIAAHSPCVIRDSGLWKMWFTVATSSGSGIFCSISADGDRWSSIAESTGLGSGAYSPFVMLYGGVYMMWFCRLESGISKIFHSQSSDGIAFSAPVLAFETLDNLNTPWVIRQGGMFKIYYTCYSMDSGRIWSRISQDGLSWSSDSLEINSYGSVNPCVLAVMEDGLPVYRMFYNEIVGDFISIITAELSDRVWEDSEDNLPTAYGDVSGIPPGFSGSVSVSMSSAPQVFKDAVESGNIMFRLVFEPSVSSRDFMVQSDYVSPSDTEAFNSLFSPESFIYNENIKGLYFKDYSISGRATVSGVSPNITVTCEECSWHRYAGLAQYSLGKDMPKPPVPGIGMCPSEAMNLWRNRNPEWLGSPLIEPAYDGISAYTARPSNKPDFVSGHHFISIMRAVEQFLAPSYVANINAYTTTPAPSPRRRLNG